MKKRIYIKDWLELKPYNSQSITDGYYLKLCNKVKEILVKRHKKVIIENMDKYALNILSCFLVSYFEDIISETNIWNTFVKSHKALYGKYLPFYDTKEYYLEEINEQDIRFLLWYFFNTIQEEEFILPYYDYFYDMAIDVYDIFDEEYEYAPENPVLKKYYEIDENETDYYKARKLIDTILFKTYLFYPDTLLDLNESLVNAFDDNPNDEFLLEYLNDIRDDHLHRVHTKLLSMS